jgi:hypothetical protein
VPAMSGHSRRSVEAELGSQVNEMSMMQAGMNLVEQITREVQLAEKGRVGYGLPCANCNIYYGADLDACPRCQCPERVSPRAFSPLCKIQ